MKGDIPAYKSILKDLKALNILLQNSPLQRPRSREQFIQLSHRLYRAFIQPIEPYLKGKKRLIIIGNEATFYLPFEVLLSNDKNKPLKELPYLKPKVSWGLIAPSFTRALRILFPPFGKCTIKSAQT